ncbi:MAG: hypothetical protein H6526_09455 [Actinobacteria bacterium]|nr:hypothetical protein [Actinomycetota bacterium]MCB8997733.1 hypothetical protein [Actinomycetota bacterium]MCB9415498.1 hypothetical protein [Actinomycetota bacterium]HRY10825.1 hypothetical protein [Candidatus Nanopelagicales bacterium]
MRITPTVAAAALVLGLLGGTAAPVAAQGDPPGAVAAKSEPLLTKKCRKQFRAGFHDKLWLDNLHHAASYFEGRRKAEQVMYDQLRWALADPEAWDLIPGIEAAAARDRADYQPVVTKQRDEYNTQTKQFERSFTRSDCLTSAKSKNIFKAAMRYLRAGFKDIYKGHEKLFAANGAIQTAQADLAGQYLTDADLEYETVVENALHARKQYRELMK